MRGSNHATVVASPNDGVNALRGCGVANIPYILPIPHAGQSFGGAADSAMHSTKDAMRTVRKSNEQASHRILEVQTSAAESLR
jgi:hypothetical protein